MIIESDYNYDVKTDEAIITLKLKRASNIIPEDTSNRLKDISLIMHSHFVNEVITKEDIL
jgi:hypothetical protein